VAALPIPIMPSPPARTTAAASRPPAAPPIGAFTIGTRNPMVCDHGVDNPTSGDITLSATRLPGALPTAGAVSRTGD
jgi:hypothetical protein